MPREQWSEIGLPGAELASLVPVGHTRHDRPQGRSEVFRTGPVGSAACLAGAQPRGRNAKDRLTGSGLTQYCYAQAGISIPHYTEDQKSVLTTVLLSEAQPGDILYKYGHVAIYIGGDQYIHEPQTGDVCKVSSGINYFTCALRANR